MPQCPALGTVMFCKETVGFKKPTPIESERDPVYQARGMGFFNPLQRPVFFGFSTTVYIGRIRISNSLELVVPSIALRCHFAIWIV